MALLFRKKDDVPRKSLWQRIKDIALTDVAVIARGGVDQGSLELLEQTLLEADFGVPVTLRLVEEVRAAVQMGWKVDWETLKAAALHHNRRQTKRG